jgi:tetratricopeptide (TPR) repeat protein
MVVVVDPLAFERLLQFPVIYNFTGPLESAEALTLADNARVLASYTDAVRGHVWESREKPLASDVDGIEAMVSLAMRIFVAENVTGELTSEDLNVLCPVVERFGAPPGAPAALERFCRRLLSMDGEMPSECVRHAPLLLACRALMTLRNDCTGGGFLVPRTSIWPLRVFFRHQLALDHRSHSLFLELADCIDAIAAATSLQTAGMLLEVGHVQNYFHRPEKAAESFLKASQISGLSFEESVMLGRRTRWQKDKMHQLVLVAKSVTALPEPPLPFEEVQGQPRVVGGETSGHDFLDRPKTSKFDSDGKEMLEEEEEGCATSMQPLSHLDKAIILALCINIRNTNPHHGLTIHHIQIYVERVLADPALPPFIIRAMSLLLRSRLEHGRPRVQERSFLQKQELLDQFRRDHEHEPSCSSSEVTASEEKKRITSTWHRCDPRYFYLVAYPTIWALKREFADACFEESLHKTALDLYEQISDWEQIIKCCKELDKRKRAESLALEKLKDDPHNPMLWVALGEATREDSHLWKAWELCGRKMAAPMRALAKLALERDQFEKVLEYFDNAVAINPVFGGDWFSLGYASLKLQRLDRCCEAFTRVCQLDPNDAYAWNNLGSVLLRQGKLRPAFSATSQALHNNRRNWRMWQNYFAIGVEIKEVTETTLALSTLLEIAQRNVTLEGTSMIKFTNNAIAYMKGEIRATDNPVEADRKQEPSEVAARDKLRLSTDDGGSAATLDDDDDDISGIAPLCSDLLPSEGSEAADNVMSDSATAAAKEEQVQAIRQQVIHRYQARLREVFQTIYSLFVDDADLYLCGAMFFGFVDGRDAALTYHQKELRCAKQRDQWERKADLFDRVCQSLLASTSLLLPHASDQVCPSSDVTGQQLRRDLKVEIDAALQVSADHLAETGSYRKLQVASRNLGKAISSFGKK